MNSYQPVPGSFPNLRQVVDPSLAGLPGIQLRAQVDGEFGEGTADLIEGDLEGVFSGVGRMFSSAARDVGRAVQQAAPVITQIGGGVLQGAMAGSAAGLPGIIAGAAVGGTGAGLSRYGKGAARDIGGAMTGLTSLAGQFSPMGRAGGAAGSALSGLGSMMGRGGGQRGGAAQGGMAGMLGGLLGGGQGMGAGPGGMAGTLGGLLGNPQIAGLMNRFLGGGRAAGQLASAVQRPEMQQAMAAMQLGGLGRREIPVGSGGSPVPTAAFAQLLSHLIGEAAAEMAESSPEASNESAEFEFMRGETGEFVGDPASLSDRAARLWAMLNESHAERFAEAIEAEWNEAGEGEGEFDSEFESDSEADSEADSEWEAWASEQEFLDSLDLAEADAIEASLEAQEQSYGW